MGDEKKEEDYLIDTTSIWDEMCEYYNKPLDIDDKELLKHKIDKVLTNYKQRMKDERKKPLPKNK